MSRGRDTTDNENLQRLAAQHIVFERVFSGQPSIFHIRGQAHMRGERLIKSGNVPSLRMCVEWSADPRTTGQLLNIRIGWTIIG